MRNQKPTTNDYPPIYYTTTYNKLWQQDCTSFFFKLGSTCRLTLYLLQLGRIFSPIGA